MMEETSAIYGKTFKRMDKTRVKRIHQSRLVVGRYTEIPNPYLIFANTDTDTDVVILNTENTENSVCGAVSSVTFETGQLNQSYWPLMFSANRNNIGY